MIPALTVLVVCASGSVAAYKDGFTYVKPDFRKADDEDCKICYGDDDCLAMNQARCDFYTATSQVLGGDNSPEDYTNPELRIQVDSLMTGLVEQSSNQQPFEECVPFLSQYTDCNKDNVCLGCQTCTCTKGNKWSCSLEQRCRPEGQLNVDHQALVIAVETLRGHGNPSFRLKRSMSTTAKTEPHNITFEEISEWFYRVKPLNYDVYASTTEAATNGTTNASPTTLLTTVTEATTTSDNITDVEPDYLAFSDVLNNISIQKNNNRRKTLNMVHRSNVLEHDYKKPHGNVTNDDINDIRMADEFVNILDAMEEDDTFGSGTTTTEGVTKVVIDLLELARRRINTSSDDLNNTDQKVTLQNNIGYDDTDNINMFNAINVMKRDVSQVTEDVNVTVSEKNNNTNSSKELKDSVYLPINEIIKDKQKEVEELLQVREKLIEILNLNRSNENVVLDKNERENGSNSYISFYNVQIVPETDYDSRRSGINLLENYLKKLRRDMFAVIKDIIRIQTLTGPKDFPKDLKMLSHAIKHFMRNRTKSHRRNKSFDNIPDLRRYQENSLLTKDFVKQYLINMLQLIDRDMPHSNALAPLSKSTRNIIYRIIKNNQLNDFSVLGSRVNDPSYNLSNDLKDIGNNWQDMTVKITDSLPWDRLHHMKLLHLVLESDINRMKDALALLDFAHSRRMMVIHDEVSTDELLRINQNLRTIHSKIREITKLPSVNESGGKLFNIFTITKQNNKKETFLKHIRNLLRSSKNDIIHLLRRNMPKSEIVKELAKKKLNDLTKKKLMEYENVMQKWQNNLDITRKKRSFDSKDSKIRIKNILPKYLRGKVSSGINSTKHKNKSKPKQRKRSKKNKRKTTAATTAKNPTTKKSDKLKP